MSYREADNGCVTRLADNVLVCEADPAWADYLAWLEAGNTPRPNPDYQVAPVGVIQLPDNVLVLRFMPEWADYKAFLAAGHDPLPYVKPEEPPITLAEAKRLRINLLTENALGRVRDVMPELGNLNALIIMRELYLSIAPAARQPTAKFTSIINIYQAWDAAVTDVKACSTIQCVIDVTPNWP